MGKLLILSCCFVIAVAHKSELDSLLVFQGEPMQGHKEATDDSNMQNIFQRLLGKRSLIVHGGVVDPRQPQTVANSIPEVMMLHKQLQNKLGWGSDGDDMKKNQQQYGPPPQQGPNMQYGPPPPPNMQYGPPPGPPNMQYGPPPQGPPPNRQYGPSQGPPPPPNQQYGPPQGPPPPNQQYGPPQGPPPPPNQQYGPPQGPPPPPNQQYGPPPPPNQQYGPPPNQQGPPPNQQYGPPPQGPPPPPNQQYGPPPSQQYGPPPPPEPSQQYGPPPPQQNQPSQEYSPPSNDIRVNQGNFGGHLQNIKETEKNPPPSSQYGSPAFTEPNTIDSDSKIIKHVYIHTPQQEDEDEPQQPRVIRPMAKQDTHYQIIFVKAPTAPKQQPMEIELPSPPERKTLVYVLVKKPEKPSEIKFIKPPATQPSKPEVYFIRYKGNGKKGEIPQDLLAQVANREISKQKSKQKQALSLSNSLSDTEPDSDSEDDEDFSNREPQSLTMFRDIDALRSITKDRDSVGYPNAEYRAPPSMLNPNEEPMSFAVYDRVRNEKVPGLMASASDLDFLVSSQKFREARKFQANRRSHYTAPGSLPFFRPSGRMINGQYLGMTSTNLLKQYYSQDVK